MSGNTGILWEITGSTGIITIGDPPANALSSPEFLSVDQLRKWTDNPEVKGVIIRGAGRNFSAGAQLDELFKMSENRDFLFEKLQAGKDTLSAIENLNIPVIAEIRGVCFGGGLEIALACHLRFCARNSLFAFPEINQHLIPGLGGTVRLAESIGQSRALSILLSGDTVNAGDAFSFGLVQDTFEKNDLTDHCLRMIKKMTGSRPKKVIMGLMQAWHNSRRMDFQDALVAETDIFCNLAFDEFQRLKAEKSADS